jgi:hypothetical protein
MASYGQDYGNRGNMNRDWPRDNQEFGYRNREMGGNFGGGNFGGGSFDRGNFGGGNFDRNNNFDRGSRRGGSFGGNNFGGNNFGGSGYGRGNYMGGGSGYNREHQDFDRHRMGERWNQGYDRDFGDRIQEGWEGLKRGFRRTFGGDYDQNYTGNNDRNTGSRMRFTTGYDRNW